MICPKCGFVPEDFCVFYDEFINKHGEDEWNKNEKSRKCPECGHEW